MLAARIEGPCTPSKLHRRAAALNDFGDLRSGLFGVLVLPDSNHLPSRVSQPLVGVEIATSVRLDFVTPDVRVPPARRQLRHHVGAPRAVGPHATHGQQPAPPRHRRRGPQLLEPAGRTTPRAPPQPLRAVSHAGLGRPNGTHRRVASTAGGLSMRRRNLPSCGRPSAGRIRRRTRTTGSLRRNGSRIAWSPSLCTTSRTRRRGCTATTRRFAQSSTSSPTGKRVEVLAVQRESGRRRAPPPGGTGNGADNAGSRPPPGEGSSRLRERAD